MKAYQNRPSCTRRRSSPDGSSGSPRTRLLRRGASGPKRCFPPGLISVPCGRRKKGAVCSSGAVAGRRRRPQAAQRRRLAQPLLLKVYQGFKFDEMAEILGLSGLHRQSRLYTALELLKAALAPSVFEVNHELRILRLEILTLWARWTRPGRREAEGDAAVCPNCREELAGRVAPDRHTFILREEEIPRRIAFVSDRKILPAALVPARVPRHPGAPTSPRLASSPGRSWCMPSRGRPRMRANPSPDRRRRKQSRRHRRGQGRRPDGRTISLIGHNRELLEMYKRVRIKPPMKKLLIALPFVLAVTLVAVPRRRRGCRHGRSHEPRGHTVRGIKPGPSSLEDLAGIHPCPSHPPPEDCIWTATARCSRWR